MSRNDSGFFSKLIGFFRLIIAAALGFALLIFVSVIVFAAIAAAGKEKEELKPHSILHLDLKGEIKERTENPLEELGLGKLAEIKSLGLIDIKKSIRHAAKDPNIDGIYLDLSSFSSGFATLFEIHKVLEEFKASGKFIVAYGEVIDEKSFMLGAAASKLYLNPQGMLEFNGLTTERFYFTRLFEKIGVKPKIFKVGDFKSAVEPYMLERMSEADRKQTTAYLNSIYDFYLQHIAQGRKISKDSLRRYSDEMSAQNAKEVLALRLVDDLFYYDDVLQELRTLTGAQPSDELPLVKLNTYFQYVDEPYKVGSSDIAVIVAEGDIVSGKGKHDEIGSDRIAAAIRKAREDEKVKAIVLRVNSRGGSALASDVMWREVQLAGKAKPIIASMSDVAASGGYYMSMGCQKIFAQPTTITGSIGIFGVLWEANDMLENKIGITFDRVNTGKLSDMGMPTKKFSKEEEAFFNKLIAEGYENFTSKAAKGRKMELDTLKKYASGRVWSGLQAKENGLIDEFGGLDEAVAEAAKMAKISEFNVKYFPKQRSLMESLQEDAFDFLRQQFFKEELGEAGWKYWKEYERVKKWSGLQAIMPQETDFK
jgi:protease-4